ncbi:MAG: Transcriptional regulator, AsnC family [uncultured Thermomicrobiales bacterium]|uniref:Transcriptional regulator, AsnC family n=1 Tax=uncultured Thermomicrobiales bacterium TaxID=1645740 RepID=A0A6J4V814_9BACT|nr:MAG: Transcriptional regulator, AsnC family [uncultured Thermomicrobiales bacterium]
MAEAERTALTRRVLRALEKDARLPVARLAVMLGADEAEVAEVVARCERAGIIRRYKTVVAWDRLDEARVTALIDVSVSPQRDVGFDQVAVRIARFPEVRSVQLVSGGSDLRVTIEGNTMHEVAEFVARKLSPIDAVTATNTHFLLRTYKEDGEVFVDEPAADGRLPVSP